uniref:Mediator of RNA polymerase II transcription subunit 4 n=4 Tax=Timema TaxID=61471 RepID=A0A7R9H2V6_TIMCR|nr:unnamed protein product [Timema cristinae]
MRGPLMVSSPLAFTDLSVSTLMTLNLEPPWDVLLRGFLRTWHEQWVSTIAQNKLRSIRDNVLRWPSSIRRSRREEVIATAIYQAKQKLQSIARANKRPVPSEDLIKFAHRISICLEKERNVCGQISACICISSRMENTHTFAHIHASVDVLSGQKYSSPMASLVLTDSSQLTYDNIEMRLGFLGRLSDMPINGPLLQQQNSLTDIHRPEPPTSQQNQFAWHPSGEIHMSVGGQGSVAMDTRNHNKENEDVEVMSTDSSSSSSSDSQ